MSETKVKEPQKSIEVQKAEAYIKALKFYSEDKLIEALGEVQLLEKLGYDFKSK